MYKRNLIFFSLQIERDFSVKYPEASANFDIKWNESFQKLIHLLKSKLVAEDKMAINIMQGSEAHTLPEGKVLCPSTDKIRIIKNGVHGSA